MDAVNVPWSVVVPMIATIAIVGAAVLAARYRPAAPVLASKPHASAEVARATSLPSGLVDYATRHYRIQSAADQATTSDVASAVEELQSAYAQVFPASSTGPFSLVLYRDRRQFKAYNRSTPWAEAYYRDPVCHAYAGDPPNRYHWMLHEATHQLLRQASGYRPARWANEGTASYFGASRIVHGRLVPGTVSANAYPIWWLAATPLSGDMDRDIELHAFVPLDDLIASDGVDIAPQLNAYYVGWWSLVHFLRHGESGRYASAFRDVVAHGASRAEFEQRIGPIPTIQREWYAYLLGAVRAARAGRLEQWQSAVTTAPRVTASPSAAPVDTPRRDSRR